ncbi:MAG: cation transporter [Ruminococcaceae bacterium]|nr:cation transporter [Oscillospiraceae bacterium]
MTKLLLKLFVKNYKNTEDKNVRERYGVLGGTVGIVCNLLLAVVKIILGIVSGSVSVVADAMNNFSDTASSVITLIGFKAAGKPADEDHPFGHGRIEYMAAFIVSALILLVGFELFKSSVEKIISPTAVNVDYITLIILLLSSLTKLWMFFFNKKLSKAADSGVLAATAQDSLNDALVTFAILVSVGVMVVFNINIDAYVGLLMSLFILYTGIKSAKETIDPLLGTPPEKELIDELHKTILSFEGFIGIHDLIVHNYGPGRIFASVHIEVPVDIDIVHCHEQVDLCEKVVNEKLGVELVVHMDPIVTNDETVNKTKEQLRVVLTGIDRRLSFHDFRMTPKGENRTNLIFDIVVPVSAKLSEEEISEKVTEGMRKIDPTFFFVITFDKDYATPH